MSSMADERAENELTAEQHFQRLQQRGRLGTGITTDAADATENETPVEDMTAEQHVQRLQKRSRP
jgi:hypothetical protein